ncbi:uncharacterized protein [Argopecten irradians]|uniref:uncharacterized protein n=1 Tax=Argopecten irradians TaxID=31199 RepID=UPI0037156B7C
MAPFLSSKEKDRRASVRLANVRRSDTQPLLVAEHSYARNVSDEPGEPGDPGPVSSDQDSSWRVGRRIVELDVLAKGLEGCSQCGTPLALKNTTRETRFGLGSSLHIMCTTCTCINKVPLGKKHNDVNKKQTVWDVNSKVAIGMLHIGIGETQLNNLLSVLNLPSINRNSLKKREGSWEIDRASGLKYNSLPYGKPLTDKKFQNSLQNIFEKYKKQADKLAFASSTQSNENFNNIVASKAPKNHHTSGSESLDYRVNAAASQKNTGYTYLVDVNKEACLSPGAHTKLRAMKLDAINNRKRQKGTLKTYKRRRLELKSQRNSTTAACELREGDTYSTNIAFEEASPDVEEIPGPIDPPLASPVTGDHPQTLYHFSEKSYPGVENATSKMACTTTSLVEHLIPMMRGKMLHLL